MKKYLAKFLAAALSVAMLTGCGSSSSAAPAEEAPADGSAEQTTEAAVEDLGDFEMIVGHAQPEGNPRYVLAPEVNLLKNEVTSTAPVRHLITYGITFYVADIILRWTSRQMDR